MGQHPGALVNTQNVFETVSRMIAILKKQVA